MIITVDFGEYFRFYTLLVPINFHFCEISISVVVVLYKHLI